MRKPTWMSLADWDLFLKLNPVVLCKHCGQDDPDLMTIDHIIPRHLGGTDELPNLQWLCGRCNSRKGIRDDLYWSQNFYFDGPLNLERARTAHREFLFEQILHYADWFTQPFTRISRVLYTNAWVVGSGKTLASVVLAFALNHIIRRDRGLSCPRIDRVLILTKEVAIRDQIVRDLRDEVVKYGYNPIAPRVNPITTSWQLSSPVIIDTHDIWVSCIHQFFEKNEIPLKDIEAKLACFPLIIFDELHFALDQVLQVVQHAHRSLCFGMTGTPITASGEQIRKIVLFSLFDYDAAHVHDHSMKFVPSPESKAWRSVFEEVDIIEADMFGEGKPFKADDTSVEGYAKNARPAITVAEAVVRHVHDCDRMFKPGGTFNPAPHRKAQDVGVIADVVYPIHAMIQAENIAMAEVIARHLNRMFEADPRKYPAELGYRAEVVRSAYEDEEGKKIKGKKLDPDHPWMLCYKNSGKISGECARFLILVDMGREGVNNPYCGVVGLATTVSSIVGHVQRTLGRQLRSVIRWIRDTFRVPADVLDTIKIFSHSAFDNRSSVEKAVRFALFMGDHLEKIPTMDSVVEPDFHAAEPSAIDPDVDLSRVQKIDIARNVGRDIRAGRTPDLGPDIEFIGGSSEAKRNKVKEWGNTVIQNPEAARKDLKVVSQLREIPRVMREYPAIEPTDETLVRFIKHHAPDLARYANELNEERRLFMTTLYRRHVEGFHLRDLPSSTSLSKIHRSIATKILQQLKQKNDFRGDDNKIYMFTGTAIRMVLGLPEGEKFRDGGEYDVPECHVILTRPEVLTSIEGWVVHTAASKGFCPNLAAGLQVAPEAESDVA